MTNFREEQAFLYSLPTGKRGYNLPRTILIPPAQYFNRRLLDFNSTLHQMHIIYFLPGLRMGSTTHIHQKTLLCTK